VSNLGEKRIADVKVIVIQVDDVDYRLQLPVSSDANLFRFPNPPPVAGTVNLNPGDDQSFDAVVECNGTFECPMGELAIPHLISGTIGYANATKSGVITRISELRVRVSGDIGRAVIQTFTVSLNSKGRLILESKSDERKK
jgi:hypothetical protein